MSQVTELLVRIKQQGNEQLTKLQGSLKGLAQQTAATNINFREVSTELRKIQGTSTQSINNLRGYSNAWKEIANSVKVGSQEFKIATAEAAKLDAQLKKVTPAAGGRGGIGRAAQIAGTVAGAGVFGGLGGAAGATIGGLVGGVPGAITGGAIGAQINGLQQLGAAVAKNVAEITKYRIALAGVSRDQEDYNKSVQSTTKFSQQFLLPIGQATEQYTRLKASIVGAGFSTNETDKVFRAIAASIIATGGNAEKLNAALNATSQVFSKGKVSAEELRQQIGERLPGAFTIFAQSLGKTPAELDKALEDGKVTLADFLKFSEELFKRYGSTADILAKAPENAGARLQVTLDAVTLAYGAFFQRVGAGFQDYASQLLAFTLDNQEKIKTVIATFAVAAQDIFALWSGLVNNLAKVTAPFFQFIFENFARGINALRTLADQSRRSAGGPEQRAARQVESLYPNPIERALKGRQAYQEALRVELAYEKNISKELGSREQRIKSLQNTLFKPFQPTRFGAGIGAGVAGGDGAASGDGGAGGGRSRQAKELVDRTKEELDLIKEINQAERNNQVLRAASAQFKLTELEVELQLQRRTIGRNQAIEKLQEAETRLSKTVESALRGIGDQSLRNLQIQIDINRAIQDAEIASGMITEEKAKQLLIERQIAEFTQKYPTASAESLERFKTAVSTSKKELTETEKLGKSIIETFASGLGSAFDSLFDKARGFNEIVSDILRSTAKLLFQFGIQSALKGLFPGLGFADGGIMTSRGPVDLKRYANGGIATSPQLALFGEGRQPEAFVPLPDGRSIPVTVKGGQMGTTNVVVNVDAKGSRVEGDGGQAKALGNAVSAAVQAEILRQQRPGGLLSSTR